MMNVRMLMSLLMIYKGKLQHGGKCIMQCGSRTIMD